MHSGSAHRLQKEEMLEPVPGGRCSQSELLLRYFCTLFEPGQLVSALIEKLGKVLLIPELSLLLLTIGYSRKLAWSINLISLWFMNRAPSECINCEPVLVLHKSRNLREKK